MDKGVRVAQFGMKTEVIIVPAILWSIILSLQLTCKSWSNFSMSLTTSDTKNPSVLPSNFEGRLITSGGLGFSIVFSLLGGFYYEIKKEFWFYTLITQHSDKYPVTI